MDHEQDGSHEQEAELDGLGDARDEGRGGGGDQDGLDFAAVLGARGVVHGQAGADQAEHLGDAPGVPDDRLAQDCHRGVCDLGVVDVAGALVDLAAHLSDAAQGGVQEGGVDQMMQAGGDEQALQHTVDEQAQVAGSLDEAAQRVDARLGEGPHIGQDDGQHHHQGDQDDEHKAGAAIDLEGIVELGLTEAVVDPGHDDAQHQAQKDAHIQHLHAQHGGLAGAAQVAFHQDAGQAHEPVHGVDEHQKGQQSDEARLGLFLVCQAHRQAHAEDDAEVGHDGVQRAGQQGAETGGDGVVEEGQHFHQTGVGEQVADRNQNTSNRQDQDGDEHRF